MLGIDLPLIVGPGLRHPVLRVVGAVPRSGVDVLEEVAGIVVAHPPGGVGQGQITGRIEPVRSRFYFGAKIATNLCSSTLDRL